MKVRETYINETKGYQFGDSGWYEPYTDERGQLFRDMQREYGGCVSKVYRDQRIGQPFTAFGIVVNRFETVPAGWVFSRRERYEDARGHAESDYYTREVWVEVAEDGGWGPQTAHRHS